MTRALAAALVALALVPAAARAQGMLDSKHNLSAYGPASRTVYAQSETQVCVFCHTPHNTSPTAPLWNRQLSGQTYTPYASNTLQATVGQPNGYSRLCLSCHDGSLAIGSVMNLGGQSQTIQMVGTASNGAFPTGSTALIGTTLTNDHPISMVFDSGLYTADGEMVNPTTLTGVIRLYEGATSGTRDSVQCTTCHDPHLVANPYFLKKPFTGQSDNLCLTCHDKPGWAGSSHESATKTFGGTAVAQLSCGACHRPHTTPGMPRLLRGDPAGVTAPAIEQTCFRCHTSTGGTTPATFNLQAQFAKTASLHRITAYSGHEPVFTVATPPEPALNTAGKHVECTDCHNPHRVRALGTAGTGEVYEGMRGINLAGNVVDDTPRTGGTNLVQYELCFRCHGDSYATAVGTAVDGDQNGTRSVGAIPTSNKRTEFQTSNSAYHPVPGAGKNTSQNLNDQLSPNGLSTSSVIKCTDCHNNDYYSGSAFRGVVSQYPASVTQPKGPHGSNNFNLLRARYWNVLPGPSGWSSTNFNVCFHCHDVTALTARRTGDGARTNFYDSINGKDNLHWVHLIDRISKVQAVCKDCHYNIHSNVEASNTQYRVNLTLYNDPNSTGIPTRLINFRPGVITPIGGRAKPEWWFNTTTKERRCYLQCHQTSGSAGGATMNGFQYRPPSGDLP